MVRAVRCRRLLFYLVSRTAIALYRTFPVFGRLQGAIAIIRHGSCFVVLQRADGLGIAFPGGMTRRGEHPADTARREVLEETGLHLDELTFRFAFPDDSLYPAETHVFEAELPAESALELRSTWEGEAREVTLAELRAGIVVSHVRVLEFLDAYPL